MVLTACLVYSQHFKSASFQVVFLNSWNTLWDTGQDKRPGQYMASNQQPVYVSLTHAYTRSHTQTGNWTPPESVVLLDDMCFVSIWVGKTTLFTFSESQVMSEPKVKKNLGKRSSLITQDMSPRDPIIDHVGSWFGKSSCRSQEPHPNVSLGTRMRDKVRMPKELTAIIGRDFPGH